MRRMQLLVLGLSLALSGCALPFLPATAVPAPQIDLAGTADVFVQQTLLAQPTPSVIPSNTSVITTPSLTAAPPTATGTPTETQNPALLTLTATLGTGTAGLTTTGTLTTSTPNPSIGATPTQTLYARFYGTLPPDPPSGSISLINKAKAEAYISLQCTGRDGKVTILEYPVPRAVNAKAPAGSYFFVAWVGGNEMTGSFKLANGSEITLTLFKDKVVVSSN